LAGQDVRDSPGTVEKALERPIWASPRYSQRAGLRG